MDPQILKRLNAMHAERRAGVLVTDLGDGRDRLVEAGDPVAGELGAAVTQALRTGVARPVSVGGRDFFVNPHLPDVRLVIIGAVHIAQALTAMAGEAGFAAEIIDPRSAFADPRRFAGTPLDARWPDDALADRPLDVWCAVVALTHDPKIDDPALRAALAADCFYVGALGSRKTHAKRLARLEKSGVSPSTLERIHAPIGLDIGAANPAEIAVAILAEVIACRRQRDPRSVRPAAS